MRKREPNIQVDYTLSDVRGFSATEHKLLTRRIRLLEERYGIKSPDFKTFKTGKALRELDIDETEEPTIPPL